MNQDSVFGLFCTEELYCKTTSLKALLTHLFLLSPENFSLTDFTLNTSPVGLHQGPDWLLLFPVPSNPQSADRKWNLLVITALCARLHLHVVLICAGSKLFSLAGSLLQTLFCASSSPLLFPLTWR